MTTSGSSDYSETARGIATAALRLVGACPLDETPDANLSASALQQLQFMMKTWGADPKPKLWLQTEGTVTLIASTRSYALTAARKVISARRRTGTGTAQNDVPLRIASQQDYADRANKLSTGAPLEVYFDPQRAARTLYVWPVPDTATAASTTIPYTYLRVIEDVDSLNDDLDTPQERLEVLEYSLAARLIIPTKMHLTDPVGAKMIEDRAGQLYGQLSAFDDEDTSMFMQPEYN